jgi:hypothetical protein
MSATTLPTPAELEAVDNALGDMYDRADDIFRALCRRTNADTGPEVTYDLIGRLAIFVADVRKHGNWFNELAAKIGRTLDDLDGIARENPAGDVPWVPQFAEDGSDNYSESSIQRRELEARRYVAELRVAEGGS